MFAALVVLALLTLGAAVIQWRSRRVALANRLLHTIVATLEALETGQAIEIPSRSAFAPLGPGLASRVNVFFQVAADPVQNRDRAFALGEALLRELRDISTHRDHGLVSRA